MRGAAHRAIASSRTGAVAQLPATAKQLSVQRRMPGPAPDVPQAEAAWALWRKLGSPRYHVAPMVDQSELPFRMLCRAHGATAAYTPMLHARLFAEVEKYRAEHFTTTSSSAVDRSGDRPLFTQFCGNDPDTVVAAARHVEAHTDYVDINFGCPQRIARRGRYGAFLMDDLDGVERLVRGVVAGLTVPVTAKIRIFPELERTLAYARMLQAAGVFVLGVHGRTREQKDNTATRANWDAIKAVKAALSIPVIANGNVRDLADAEACLAYTGADAVMSAESLLADPALFSSVPDAAQPWAGCPAAKTTYLMEQYLDLCDEYPVVDRMVRGHVHKMLGSWLAEFTDLRQQLVQPPWPSPAGLRVLTLEMRQRIEAVAATGRTEPVPAPSDRKRAAAEKAAAIDAARAAQAVEDTALRDLDGVKVARTAGVLPSSLSGTSGNRQHVLTA